MPENRATLEVLVLLGNRATKAASASGGNDKNGDLHQTAFIKRPRKHEPEPKAIIAQRECFIWGRKLSQEIGGKSMAGIVFAPQVTMISPHDAWTSP